VALDEICPGIGQWYIRSDALVTCLIRWIGASILVKLFVFWNAFAFRGTQNVRGTMDDHQDIEPNQSLSPTGGFLHIILGVILLLLVVVGLIAGWGTFLKAAPILVQILI